MSAPASSLGSRLPAKRKRSVTASTDGDEAASGEFFVFLVGALMNWLDIDNDGGAIQTATYNLRSRRRPKRKAFPSRAGEDDDSGKSCHPVRPVLHAQGRLNDALDDLLVVEKAFCNYCGDYMPGRVHACVTCGALMCEQNAPLSAGCIELNTLKEGEPFRCPTCESRDWNSSGALTQGADSMPPVSIPANAARRTNHAACTVRSRRSRKPSAVEVDVAHGGRKSPDQHGA